MHHPLLLGLLIFAGLYLAKLWCDDFRAARRGKPQVKPLPGATAAPLPAIVIAVSGSVLLLAIETLGEHALGITGQQSRMTWLFAVYSVFSAPVIEEIVFRGMLVIENRGLVARWAGAIGASVVFALLHPFLWRWEDTGFTFALDVKGWFSSGMVFAMSLWLYAVRLARWNPQRSLLPCFAGHAAKNLGVVLIKAGTGFMESA